jgi:hypothetical protein
MRCMHGMFGRTVPQGQNLTNCNCYTACWRLLGMSRPAFVHTQQSVARGCAAHMRNLNTCIRCLTIACQGKGFGCHQY